MLDCRFRATLACRKKSISNLCRLTFAPHTSFSHQHPVSYLLLRQLTAVMISLLQFGLAGQLNCFLLLVWLGAGAYTHLVVHRMRVRLLQYAIASLSVRLSVCLSPPSPTKPHFHTLSLSPKRNNGTHMGFAPYCWLQWFVISAYTHPHKHASTACPFSYIIFLIFWPP